MSLPSALQPMTTFPRWLGWHWITLPDGKRDKPPCRADFPEFPASTNNPATWTAFGTAAASFAAGKVSGIGYVCADDAERVYVDLDDCIDPITHEIADWAMRLVEECNSYTEITPSNVGLRIIGTHGGALKAPIHTGYKLPSGGHGEVFFRAVRYITVTGNRLPGTPDALADIAEPVLDLLMAAGKARAASPEFAGAKSAEHMVAPLGDIRAALETIGNPDLHYEDWVRIGIAAFGASGGSMEGYEAWQAWSAKSAKHLDDQCLRVWKSIERSPPTKIGFGSLAYLARSANPLWVAPSWRGEVVDVQEHTAPPEPGFTKPAGPVATDIFPTLSIEEVMALPPPTWLVEGVLTEGGFGSLYAPPASFKSFVALSLALAVAYGRPWMGKVTVATGVLYIAGEGARGQGKRIKAWQRKHGLEGVDAPFRLLAMAINLTDPLQTAKVVRTAMAAAAMEGCPIGLVIIDTVARSMAGAEENSAKDMGLFVDACGVICREVSAAVLGIHHTGKDTERGARGSNALLGGVDAEIKLERQDTRLVMTITKQKDAEEGDPLTLRVEKVEIGTHLVPATSLVVVPDSDATQATSGGESMADRGARMAALGEISKALGPNGSLTTQALCNAIGWRTGSHAYERIAKIIPFAPDCADVTTHAGLARLWRVRQGDGEKSPIIVRRQDIG